MGDVIEFKRPKPSEKQKGQFLCRNGHHKWVVVQEKQFDVKLGKLVTLYRCSRCNAQKTKAL